MEKMTGKVWVLGDDIDTDIIIPTEYLALKTIDDMKQYGFSPLRPELAGQIEKGDIIVYGDNQHVVIYDGNGGYYGNSSSQHRTVHGSDYTAMNYAPTKIIKTSRG